MDIQKDGSIVVANVSTLNCNNMRVVDSGSGVAELRYGLGLVDNTDDPVVNYQFQGDLTDSSGNGHDLSRVSGSVDSFDMADGDNQVLLFDGAVDYKAANHADLEITGDLTLGMCFFLMYQAHGSSTANYQSLVRFGGSGAGSAYNHLYTIYLAHSNTQRFFPAWVQQHGSQDSTNGTYNYTACAIPQHGQWVTLWVKRESNVITYHVAGVKVATSGSLTAADTGTSSELWVGSTVSSAQRVLGAFHQIVIYDQALSDAVIAERSQTMCGSI